MGWQDAPIANDAAQQPKWMAAPKATGATQAPGASQTPPPAAAPQGGDPAKAATGRTQVPRPRETGDSTTGFIAGNLNKGIANLAGLPVDTAANALNLGIAGYGFLRGGGMDQPRTRGGQPYTPPSLIENPVGGSQWFQGLMQRGNMIGPSAEPQSPAGRYAASALQMAPGAMIGRPTLAQAPRALGATTTSAIGSEAARDIGGDEWAPVGAMVPGAGKMQHKPAGERATAQRKAEAFGKAREMGVPVPPSALKPNKAQQAVQNKGNQELRQPEGTEFTPQTLQAYRTAHFADYQAVIDSPALKGGVQFTPRFQSEVQAIGSEISAASQSLPQTFKTMKPVLKLLGEYGFANVPPNMAGKVQVPPRQQALKPEQAMRAVKKLRDDATTNYASDKPEKVELARVQKKLANSLEQMIEDNIKDPALMQKFREARTAIAKSHDYQAAMGPGGRIDAAKLAQMQAEGSPLSGGTRDIAQVAGAFPSAVKPPKEDVYFTQKTTPMAMTHAPAIAAHQAPRMWDRMMMTGLGQRMIDPRGYLTPQQQQLIRYLSAAQAGVPTPPQ